MAQMRMLALVMVFLMTGVSISWAETIKLNSGKVVEGSIFEKTADGIRVDQGIGVILSYYNDEIESIDGVKPMGGIKIETADAQRNASTVAQDAQPIKPSLILEEYPEDRSWILPLENEVKDLFENKDFNKLEQILNDYANEQLKDFKSTKIMYAVSALTKSNPDFEAVLDEWIKTKPESTYPYLTKGIYYYHVGYDRRGEDSASKTSAEQFTAMRKYFAQAKILLEKAISLNPQLSYPYRIMILMSSANSDYELKNRYIDVALQRFPSSYKVHENIIHTLKPRWGGSYEQMEQFIKERQKFLSDKSVRHLKSEIAYDQASMWNIYGHQAKYPRREKLLAKESRSPFNKLLDNVASVFSGERGPQTAEYYYNKAIEAATMGLEIIETSELYDLRANAKEGLEDKEGALLDEDKALKLDSQCTECAETKVRLLVGMDRASDAITDAKKITERNPHSSSLYDVAGNLRWKGQYDVALGLIDEYLRNNPNDAAALAERGYCRHNLGQLDGAVADYKRALELAGPDFDVMYPINMLGLILCQRKDFPQALELLNKYIQLRPRDGDLYSIRAIVFEQAGNLGNAKSDYRKACDLGSKISCGKAR